MAIYQAQTIKRTIEDIQSGKLVIPALQRNFVWPESKITDLFDSLLRNYPIGTFLFWDVSGDTFNDYSFNKILSQLRETRNKKYRGEPAESGRTEYNAVLDGQQRITSLAIGILGKYSVHKKNWLWDSDASFVDKYLCINLLHKPIDNDDKYDFRFMPVEDIGFLKELDVINDESQQSVKEYEYWLKIADVYSDDSVFNSATNGLYGFISSLESSDPNVFSLEKRNFIFNLLTSLRSVLREKEVISVYTTSGDLSLPEVVDIFVRVNSGGQKLDDADLILSIASGENSDESFYDKIVSAIDDIQAATQKEFKCDKKFILTVCLLWIGAEKLSLKDPKNYSRQTITKIIEAWDDIIEKTKAALIFVEKLGFDVSKISSSLIVPIIYYFKLTDRKNNYYDIVQSKADRVYIRQWIFRAIINGLFDEGTGKTMLRIRTLLDEAYKDGIHYFPLDRFIEQSIKKPLLINDEQIADILDWKWPDPKIKALMLGISPTYTSGDYSMDHMWPQTLLKSKNKLKALTPHKSDAERKMFKDRCDYFPNIQLLTQSENSQKLTLKFDEWIDNFYSDVQKKSALLVRNIIPDKEENYVFEKFIEFNDDRAALLKERIKESFPDSFLLIKKRHGL